MMLERASFESDKEYDAYVTGYRDAESDVMDIVISHHDDIQDFVQALSRHLDATSIMRMNEGHRKVKKALEELVEAAENWEPEVKNEQ